MPERPDAGRLPVRDTGLVLSHDPADPDFGALPITDTNANTGTDIVIETITIERITVPNPRVRDAEKFAEIVDSIDRVGLMQPVKVSRTTGDEGEISYNLVYGQGRMEPSSRSDRRRFRRSARTCQNRTASSRAWSKISPVAAHAPGPCSWRLGTSRDWTIRTCGATEHLQTLVQGLRLSATSRCTKWTLFWSETMA